jgi:hypothetical protein
MANGNILLTLTAIWQTLLALRKFPKMAKWFVGYIATADLLSKNEKGNQITATKNFQN